MVIKYCKSQRKQLWSEMQANHNKYLDMNLIYLVKHADENHVDGTMLMETYISINISHITIFLVVVDPVCIIFWSTFC